MTTREITYRRYNNGGDNCRDVIDFITELNPDAMYVCKRCGGYGEYEGEYGPIGCGPCCSRLIFFHDVDGRVMDCDWGDTIVADEEGCLTLRKGPEGL